MFFRKRPAEANEAAGDPLLDEELDQSEGVAHGRYMIFSRTKQLHSGNWIVNIILQEDRPEGPRRYDYFGPMSEYPTAEEASKAGVVYAIERLDRDPPTLMG